MGTISLSGLLKIMSIETFHKLKARGGIIVVRNAPYTEIDAASLPNRFQEALSRPSIP